ncbi:MAG: hypothetical protein ABSE36_11805 [Terracidiphilus sp.]|jgi:hypothetical protein
MYKPHVELNFQADEWGALLRMAQKYRMDVGSILRIAGVAILEAERQGKLAITHAADAIVSPEKLN